MGQEEEKAERERVAREIDEAIAKKESALQEAKARVENFMGFIRNEVSLRSQHILDPAQEEAKRAHFYDGVPILIEGGPGTGKTTTMIQRLKFLIDCSAIDDYGDHLSTKQKEQLKAKGINSWKFFSPTPLLLRYLMKNMNEEGLGAVEGENIITIGDFRKMMLNEYQLHKMDTDGPFKDYKKSSEQPLIFAPQTAIKEFEAFCVRNSRQILLAAATLKTDSYSWHTSARNIKEYCSRAAKVNNMEQLMNLFNSMQDNEQKAVKDITNNYKEVLQKSATIIQRELQQFPEKLKKLRELFKKWEMESQQDLSEDNEDEMDESNEADFEEDLRVDFETSLYANLKKALRNVALQGVDNSHKVPSKDKELMSIVGDANSKVDMTEIGELALFMKKYAFLCRGIESNVINQIPRLYKVYRKSLLKIGSSACYNLPLLKQIVNKDKNKHLHHDEQDLLIGFINNMAMSIARRSKDRYEKLLRNKYIRAYNDNCCMVIGIDEATDYTVLDYYLMYSFRSYVCSAVSMCGDLMQGLNYQGVVAWSEIEKVIPNLQISSLAVSYRQLPTLTPLFRCAGAGGKLFKQRDSER